MRRFIQHVENRGYHMILIDFYYGWVVIEKLPRSWPIIGWVTREL